MVNEITPTADYRIGEIDVTNDDLKTTFVRENIPFERIRRVTGYLTGDVKQSFNNAKQAEERDRVKHNERN